MAIELLVIVLLIVCTIGLGNLLQKIALPGLRTGKLQARGRIYSRSSEPIRFWFGIVFWFLMFLMMLTLSLLGTVQIWTRLT